MKQYTVKFDPSKPIAHQISVCAGDSFQVKFVCDGFTLLSSNDESPLSKVSDDIFFVENITEGSYDLDLEFSNNQHFKLVIVASASDVSEVATSTSSTRNLEEEGEEEDSEIYQEIPDAVEVEKTGYTMFALANGELAIAEINEGSYEEDSTEVNFNVDLAHIDHGCESMLVINNGGKLPGMKLFVTVENPDCISYVTMARPDITRELNTPKDMYIQNFTVENDGEIEIPASVDKVIIKVKSLVKINMYEIQINCYCA